MREGFSRNRNRVFLAIFIVLALGISAAGLAVHIFQKRHIHESKLGEVTAIADLKVSAIATWREQQKHDISNITRSVFTNAAAKTCISHPGDQAVRVGLEQWMKRFVEDFDYRKVLLLDPAGRRVLSHPPGESLDAKAVQEILKAPVSPGGGFTSFYRNAAGEVSIDVFIRIPDMQNPGNPAVGFLVADIDPSRFLFPYIQRWPVPSTSAETLLVERQGNEVVFLNEARHGRHPALTMRRSLGTKEDDTGNPACERLRRADHRAHRARARSRPGEVPRCRHAPASPRTKASAGSGIRVLRRTIFFHPAEYPD